MHKYQIIIYWSDEDEIFIAEVPELPGCMTHGDTQAAALANADMAIQGWIDTATKFGDPIPEPKGRTLVSDSIQLRSKRQSHGERLHRRRGNNPRTLFNIERPRVRMNPKAR